MMLGKSSLRKTDGTWTFRDETTLEDFVWEHLSQLFGLTRLKRQFTIDSLTKEEICDILAVAPDGGLVILELKNKPDHYVVQQLTRYYDRILTVKPFAEQVSYGQPVRLIAVMPSIHQRNLIDRKYHTLNIDLYSFTIIQDQYTLSFTLSREDGETQMVCPIPYAKAHIPEDADTPPAKELPRVPRAFQKVLDEHLPTQKQRILEIREHILSLDDRMREVISGRTLQYGLKKHDNDVYQSKLYAEFFTEFSRDKFSEIHFSLWLPYPTGKLDFDRTYTKKDKRILRFAIQVEDDWHRVRTLCVQQDGNQLNRYKFRECFLNDFWKLYSQLTDKPEQSSTLDSFLKIAFDEWLERVK